MGSIIMIFHIFTAAAVTAVSQNKLEEAHTLKHFPSLTLSGSELRLRLVTSAGPPLSDEVCGCSS